MNYIGLQNNNNAKIEELLNLNKNGFCADCCMTLTVPTAWAVLSYGIFVCDDCKLVHIEQENHCKTLDKSGAVENSVTATGILSTYMHQRWEEKDFEQMRINGNEKVNQKLLKNVPQWKYRPTASDGIKHKEYWINYKYGNGAGAGDEIPKTAGKSFIGIQFTRTMPKGNFPCCAVLQNDKLYLTSDTKNEEIHIENIETVLFNPKRIGKEYGVQLTCRTTSINGPHGQKGVTYTYLLHENMETVLDWINLILYTKFNLLQSKFPNYSKDDVAKMLNCATVKESYMSASNHGLTYVSLSEARIACFQHHLDENPLFTLPVSKALKLSGAQYLEALAHFFNMDVGKIFGYEDWNSCIEYALNLDKLAYLADELSPPINSAQLLPAPKPAVPAVPAEVKQIDFEKKIIQEKPAPPVFSPEEESKPIINAINEVKPHNDERGIVGIEKADDKPVKSFDCYPPIGPMGEMGKVARGELPPEAIIPGPPKVDPTRMMFGGMAPQMIPTVTSPPLVHPMMQQQNMTTMNHNMMPTNQPRKSTDCYPPISGPIRDMPDVFQPMPRLPVTTDDGFLIDEYKPHNMNNAYKNQVQERTFKGQMSVVSEQELYARFRRSNGVQSPTDLPQFPRSDSWSGAVAGRSMDQQQQQQQQQQQWPMKQTTDHFFQQAMPKSGSFRIGHSPTGQEQVIIEHLQREWSSAERKLLALIHNGYVPASNMTAAGLDANSLDHTQTCITELFELLWKKRYDLALSFLRGFREVFSRSAHIEIRNQFIGVGELDTMKQIFLQQGREKFIKASRNTWRQNSDVEHSWPMGPSSVVRDPPTTEFNNPWSPQDTSNTISSSSLWGSLLPPTQSPVSSLNSDPWSNTSGFGGGSSQSILGNGSRSFNRAPSRPSNSRSSFSETSPTEGSFESKASSNSSASPGVITPPASLDSCLNSTALTGIETTLNHLFLNSSASGSTLWN